MLFLKMKMNALVRTSCLERARRNRDRSQREAGIMRAGSKSENKSSRVSKRETGTFVFPAMAHDSAMIKPTSVQRQMDLQPLSLISKQPSLLCTVAPAIKTNSIPPWGIKLLISSQSTAQLPAIRAYAVCTCMLRLRLRHVHTR